MPHLIIVYDSPNPNKYLKLLRRYLNWVQNSVFEGDILDSKYSELKIKLNEILDNKNDRLVIFKNLNSKYLDVSRLGTQDDFNKKFF